MPVSNRPLGLLAILLVAGLGCGDDERHETEPLVYANRAYVLLPDGSGDFANLQAAIDGAADGDTILLACGRYSGPGNRDLALLGKSLLLRPENGSFSPCTLDAAGTAAEPHRCFSLQTQGTPGTQIQDLVLTGGYAKEDESWGGYGGAVICRENANPTFESCKFTGNYAEEVAGAVACLSTTPAFVDCAFEDNSASHAGALSFSDLSPTMLGCRFVRNAAEARGGAIYAGAWHGTNIKNCSFAYNSAEEGGAIYFGRHDWAPARIDSCSFLLNQATIKGGHICANGTALHMSDTMVASGAASFGGGVYISDNNQNEEWSQCDRCTFWENRADQIGGGLYAVNGSRVDLKFCTFIANDCIEGASVSFSFAGVVMTNSIIAFSVNGAATHRVSTSGSMKLTCCNLYGNAGGDWTGYIEDQGTLEGNLSVDPLFCNYPTGDFRLQLTSPCSELGTACGLMGAWKVGCGRR